MNTVHHNCRHFRGDIPCSPHKREGVHCGACAFFDPVDTRILIIKLDAVGDVLRTTSILPGLKERYPRARTTWITRPPSLPLFSGNTLVDRVFPLEQAGTVLQTDEFDIVINLDAAPASARLAAIAQGKKKLGYAYDPKGFVFPLGPEAEEWFLMGLFDDRKKANRRTYQSLMLDICGLRPSIHELTFFLSDAEQDFARTFALRNGIREGDLVVGLNTGAGGRWEKKKWTERGYRELIGRLKKKHANIKLLLYGGPEESERNARILAGAGDAVIDTGGKNSLREFAALLNLSRIVVTGDTLALHLAVALKKQVIALIGPTSAAELDLYGRGVKITSELPCLCCYLPTCGRAPDCMESIPVQAVLDAIEASFP